MRKEVAKLAPEREAMALAFMQKNHPELNELLVYLKERDQQRYRLAVHGLHRTSLRLAQYHDRGDTGRADRFPGVIGEAMGVTVGVDIRNYRA